MQYASILKMLGFITSLLAIFLLIPTVYAFVLGTSDFHGFLFSFIIAATFGGLLAIIPKSKHGLKYKDSYALVTFGWLGAGFFGCLPYFLSNAIPGFTDAYFESISGFTTTGASILTEIEALHRPTLLWRSLTQWLGGMGIIVFCPCHYSLPEYWGEWEFFRQRFPGQLQKS